MSVGRPRWTSPSTCSIAMWTWDGRATSAWRNLGRVGGSAAAPLIRAPRCQPVLAAPEARRQRGLAAVLEHEQVLVEPQPPIPALTPAPGDQVGAAVKTIPHQHRLGARREKTGRRHPDYRATAARCSAKPIAPWVCFTRQASGRARPPRRTATITT